MKEMYFSYDGRINRAKYWGYNILLSAILLPLYMLFAYAPNVITTILYIGASLAVCYCQICLAIKRCHDLNKSGHFYWLSLIPFVNLYPAILLAFFKGSDGSNQYGDDPIVA